MPGVADGKTGRLAGVFVTGAINVGVNVNVDVNAGMGDGGMIGAAVGLSTMGLVGGMYTGSGDETGASVGRDAVGVNLTPKSGLAPDAEFCGMKMALRNMIMKMTAPMKRPKPMYLISRI